MAIKVDLRFGLEEPAYSYDCLVLESKYLQYQKRLSNTMAYTQVKTILKTGLGEPVEKIHSLGQSKKFYWLELEWDLNPKRIDIAEIRIWSHMWLVLDKDGLAVDLEHVRYRLTEIHTLETQPAQSGEEITRVMPLAPRTEGSQGRIEPIAKQAIVDNWLKEIQSRASRLGQHKGSHDIYSLLDNIEQHTTYLHKPSCNIGYTGDHSLTCTCSELSNQSSRQPEF